MEKQETKHTPGPWEIHYGSDGPEIHGEGSTGGLVIADISPEWGGDEIAEANARLIAAAPDSLKAAEDALLWWHSIPAHILAKEPPWVAECRAAISKAKGE